MKRERVDNVVHLLSKWNSRQKDQRLQAILFGVDPLKDSRGVGGSLSGPALSLSDHIASACKRHDSALLNYRRAIISIPKRLKINYRLRKIKI